MAATFDQSARQPARPIPEVGRSGPPAAPAGYLGDPAVDHTVTGSPYNTNVFRIEGPPGSFPGSPDQCANAGLGDSPTATDDCIETKLFSVVGKKATRAGVQVTKAVYADETGGHTIDLFARSEAGQKLVVSGAGVADTDMRGDGNGNYYARVFAGGATPTDLKVTNATDSPNTVDHVAASVFDDKVHINSAQFDNDTGKMTVDAQSGDGASPEAVGLPGRHPGAARLRGSRALHRQRPRHPAGRRLGHLLPRWLRLRRRGDHRHRLHGHRGRRLGQHRCTSSRSVSLSPSTVRLHRHDHQLRLDAPRWAAVSFTANAPSFTFTPTVAGSYTSS